MFKAFALALLALAILVTPTAAQPSRLWPDGPRELLQRSIDTPSPAERAAIRVYLAQSSPDTAEGLFARAWVTDANGGDGAEVMALYQRAIELRPDFSAAMINLAIIQRNHEEHEAARQTYEQAIRQKPLDAFALSNYFFLLKDVLADEETAIRMLDDAESEGLAPAHLVTAIRGRHAQSSGDLALAERLYTEAMSRGAELDTLQRLTDVRLSLLEQRSAPVDERAAALADIIAYARQNRNAGAYLYVARALLNRLQARSEAFDFYERSFYSEPTVEAATEAFDAMSSYDYPQATRLLDEAVSALGWSWQVFSYLGLRYQQFELDENKAESFSRKALELASLNDDVGIALDWLNEFYGVVGRHQEGLEVIDTYLPSLSGRALGTALRAKVDNRLHAQDFAAGLEALSEVERLGGTLAAWIHWKRDILETGSAMQAEREAFYARNPFLLDWERRFGASLRLAVEFETNSDVIRSESYASLDAAAAALEAPGGADYIFLIEGHTDNRGTDAINLPLSEARAASVRGYLEDRHGIPASRLRVAGYGPRQPVATNATADGQQRNRRVEIRPLGNITEPRIVVSGQIDANALVVSSDGRLGAVGSQPVQLWNLEDNVKVRDLYRGGSSRAFSPNGRYLAVASDYNEASGYDTRVLYIYDTKTGHAVAQLHADHALTNLAWSPFSEALAYSDSKGTIRIYDVVAQRQTAVTRVATRQISAELIWLADGSNLVASASMAQTIELIDIRTGEIERELHGVDWVHALGQSADGAYLVAVDNRRRVSIWSVGTWGRPVQFQSPLIPSRIVAHPSRPLVLMNDNFQSEAGLMLVDLAQGEIVAQSPADMRLSIAFLPDGTQFVAGSGDRIDRYDTASLRKVGALEGHAPQGHGLTLDTVHDRIVSRDTDGSRVWDLVTGKNIHTLRTETAFGWQPLDSGGSRLATVNTDGALVLFAGSDFTERMVARPGLTTTWLGSSENYIVIAGKPTDVDPDKAHSGLVEVRRKSNFQLVSSFELTFLTDRLLYGELFGSGFQSIAISEASGTIALSTYWGDGYGRGRTKSRLVQVFELATGRRLHAIPQSDPVESLSVRPESAELVVVERTRGSLAAYDLTSGTWRRNVNPEKLRSLPLGDGRSIEYSADQLRLGERSARFPGTLQTMVAHEARNLIVTLGVGNELDFFSLDTLERHLTIVSKSNDQWIAFAPTGEFTASMQGTQGVFWSLGDNYLPFDALKARFEKPRVIQDRLAWVADDLGPRPPEPTPVDPEVFAPPYRVSLLSPAEVVVEEAEYLLRLSIEKDRHELPDPEIEYTLNGRIVPKPRGFDEEPVFDGGEIIGVERRFALQEGPNVIEASLVHQEARVLTQRVEVTWQVTAQPEVRPTAQLWFFGVGVSEYEISTQNLEYAHKDALEIERILKAQEGVLYSKVNTRVLVNSDATERGIRIEMNDFLRMASAEDVIIIFLAGHGVQDNEQRLHLITHDGDMERPYTGMAIDTFRDFLRGRPINQKAIFLMDICHAGTVGPRQRGRMTAEDAVRSLADGTGTIVVASSTGAQSSLEDEDYGGGHGAFTAALLEGMQGTADSDAGNADGFVSVQELISFTARRVPQLTQGAQHPTIPLLENMRDFPLAAAS